MSRIKGGKENENFAILEPLEYINFLQVRNIKAGNSFMCYLVQLPHLTEIIDNDERVNKEKIIRNGKKGKIKKKM